MARFPSSLLFAAIVGAAPVVAAEAPQRAATSGFMLADVDGDGRVTLDELQTLFHAHFSALDADSDGRVAIADLQAGQAGPGSGPPEPHRRPPPPRGEGNFHGPPPGAPGDFAGPPPGPPPPLAGGFPFPRPEDSDEDGVISRAEYLAPAAAMLDAWDRNRDGAVSADEASAAGLTPPPARADEKDTAAPSALAPESPHRLL